jgi:2-polyprenyl-3-methyl-5-hydroxy-6-metoxy-1,4-benzoquinol methylase
MTSRQDREILYHKVHAEKLRLRLAPISYEVLQSSRRRWWNAYWSMYGILLAKDLRDKTALVVGCGSGIDAIYLAKLGARVHAFDLSPDMISLAGYQAAQEAVDIEFRIMSAEQLSYSDNTFDVILVRDILHHCEVDSAVAELIRVSRDDCFIVIDELFTHSILQKCRESRLGSWLQTKLAPVIYQRQEPYITKDERKLNETQLRSLKRALTGHHIAYFYLFVNRFVPESWTFAAKLDCILLRLLRSMGSIFAGRFLIAGHLRKGFVAKFGEEATKASTSRLSVNLG